MNEAVEAAYREWSKPWAGIDDPHERQRRDAFRSGYDAATARLAAERDAARAALQLYADRANWRRMPIGVYADSEADVWYAPVPPWEPARAALAPEAAK